MSLKFLGGYFLRVFDAVWKPGADRNGSCARELRGTVGITSQRRYQPHEEATTPCRWPGRAPLPARDQGAEIALRRPCSPIHVSEEAIDCAGMASSPRHYQWLREPVALPGVCPCGMRVCATAVKEEPTSRRSPRLERRSQFPARAVQCPSEDPGAMDNFFGFRQIVDKSCRRREVSPGLASWTFPLAKGSSGCRPVPVRAPFAELTHASPHRWIGRTWRLAD
jgi:hypothetical protein